MVKLTEWWHLYQNVKGQLYYNMIMLCKNTFLAIIQRHNSGTEGKIVTIFHAAVVMEIIAAHIKLILEVFFTVRLKTCVKLPCFGICSFFAATSRFEALETTASYWFCWNWPSAYCRCTMWWSFLSTLCAPLKKQSVSKGSMFLIRNDSLWIKITSNSSLHLFYESRQAWTSQHFDWFIKAVNREAVILVFKLFCWKKVSYFVWKWYHKISQWSSKQ